MTNVNGEPLGDPNLHDGNLTGIVVDADGTLILYCAAVSGERYVLRLPRLERLRAKEFLEGNVIDDLYIYTRDFPSNLVGDAYGASPGDAPQWLVDRIRGMQRDSWTLLRIESSLGCSLVAIAQDPIEIDQV